MNRIETALQALQEKEEKAFITYITAGLPDYDKTKAIIKAQEAVVQEDTDVLIRPLQFEHTKQMEFNAAVLAMMLTKPLTLLPPMR